MSLRLPLLPPVLRWGAVAVVAGLIFYGSIVTVPPETAVDTFQPDFVALDKWRHFVAYGTLAFALAYAVDDRILNGDLDRRLALALVVGLGVLYGAGIEFGQYVLAHRVFDVNDVLANAIGASLVAVWYLVRPRIELVPIGEWR